MVRLAIVVSHPIQHFCPLYREIASDGRLSLRVFFGSMAGLKPYVDPDFARTIKWDGTLTRGFDHEFLPGAETASVSRPIDNPAVASRLRAWNPDVVLAYGFLHGISRRAFLWARLNGRSTLQIADSELRSARGLLARVRKRISVPMFLKAVDGFLTVGDLNEQYYRSYGARPEQFFRSPFPIDNSSLDAAIADRPRFRLGIRSRFGLSPDTRLLLSVGKLTSRKRPQDGILALARVRAELAGCDIRLVFCGDGPEMEAVKSLAAAECPGAALFPGFVNTATLPEYYVAADALVHPSSGDPHPLAISEAVYCGLPVVVSDRVGSVGATDDVRIGENGMEYPCGDVDALAGKLIELFRDDQLRRRMADRSLFIGSLRRLSVSVEGVVRAAEKVAHDRGRAR